MQFLQTKILMKKTGGKPVTSDLEDHLLATNKLVKEYRQRRVVNGVSINVCAGEVVGVVKPNAGSVTFDHRDVTRLPMHQRARLGMSYLTQEPSVFRKLTVEQNILAILETCKMNRA